MQFSLNKKKISGLQIKGNRFNSSPWVPWWPVIHCNRTLPPVQYWAHHFQASRLYWPVGKEREAFKIKYNYHANSIYCSWPTGIDLKFQTDQLATLNLETSRVLLQERLIVIKKFSYIYSFWLRYLADCVHDVRHMFTLLLHHLNKQIKQVLKQKQVI